MKLTGIMAIAAAMLCAVHSTVLAQEPDRPAGEFRQVTPEEMEARLAAQWWRKAGDRVLPPAVEREGTWILTLDLQDEGGRQLHQSEMLIQANTFASSKSLPVPGQYSVGDYTTLDDYRFLLWAFPSQYDETFREYGYLDWPSGREGVKVTRADGSEIDLGRPDLSEEQVQELFAQMLKRAAVLEYDGMRMYIFSNEARQAYIRLDWDAGINPQPVSSPGANEQRVAEMKQRATPAAEFTLYLAGGQWAGGETVAGGEWAGGETVAGGEWSGGGTIAGGQWSGGGTIASGQQAGSDHHAMAQVAAANDEDGGEFAGGGDVAGTDTEGGEWSSGGDQFANAHLAVKVMQAEKRGDFKPSTSVADRNWWSSLDPSIRPDPYTSQGRWLLDFNLMYETGRVVSESSLQLIEGFPAQLSNVRGRGQDSDPDYGNLDDYYLLAWVIPDQLHAEFLQSGYLDWPVPNSDRLVVGEDGQYIESSPPQLDDKQKLALFNQAMSHVHHMLMEGLHFYVFSPQAASADFVLKWQDGMQGGNTRDVASFSVNFANGGQWSGGES
ncbi:hypothetical protein KDL29_10775 [bacterium]|nr:hypothetical protein [bacterium]